MQFNQLGSSDLQVSEICLGTMTFGIQNTQQDANDQLDYAVDYGINFIDTAERHRKKDSQNIHQTQYFLFGDPVSQHSRQQRRDFP